MEIPIATYRLQFNPSFTFKDALKTLNYLSALGITGIYSSPILKSKSGSTHGYDVVDPIQINPELGGAQGFNEVAEEAKRQGLIWIQDIVPNHMAYDSQNYMLMDVLENGRNSAFFDFFDIDWNHPYENIRKKVLAPFLGEFYGLSLEEGKIWLEYNKQGFSINYFQLKLPSRIESYSKVLSLKLGELEQALGSGHTDIIRLSEVLSILNNLASGREKEKRYAQISYAKDLLWQLYSNNPEIKSFLNNTLAAFNGRRGDLESFNLLDELLGEQLFRLSFWKAGTEELNYRRFFNIADLISLRMENENVFQYTHALIFRLLQENRIAGLRIDHIDGLYDPATYLKRLRKKPLEAYIVVEKILGFKEELPSFWPVQGTTGYDFLNYANGAFCVKQNRRKLDRIYSKFNNFNFSYETLVSAKKRLIIGKHMASDIDNLAHLMKRILSKDRHGSDFTMYGLKRAIVEIMAHFSVYRTYINKEVISRPDKAYIKEAINKAIAKNPDLFFELKYIENMFLLDFSSCLAEKKKDECINFVMRFQQFCAAIMAKGFEDTFLYVYNRLISLNEVGSSPDEFGVFLEEFHSFNKRRMSSWPHSLNATQTHDAKRGEDVRARINVLSEIPAEWEDNFKAWHRINRIRKRIIRGMHVPDNNDEYFIYQTLISSFPFYESEYPQYLQRIKEYVIKAVREAKVYTGWLKPDIDYEQAYISFVEDILSNSENNQFLKTFLPFQKKISHYGIFNSLSQALLKIASPGVPDFYQGTELWDLSLVDPDNRMPVDFEKRRNQLEYIKAKSAENNLDLISELFSTKEDGRIKFFVIYKALQARKNNSLIFQKGRYLPLKAGGRFRDNIIAFARNFENAWAIIVCPRFLTSVVTEEEFRFGKETWQDTYIELPQNLPSLWKNIFTEEMLEIDKGGLALPVNKILTNFPVALCLAAG